MLTHRPIGLGHHRNRSRVTWHPGSTPAYSSLWITVQRFLALNQPSRGAFSEDFLRSDPFSHVRPARTGDVPDCFRLGRFLRVLQEPREVLRYGLITQFPEQVRAYFGEFSVCPVCLSEGFHSVLFALQFLRTCPVHGYPLESLSWHSKVPADLFESVLRDSFACCYRLAITMTPMAARVPARHPQRDLALGEIADWLMDCGQRCWLGQYATSACPPLQTLTWRLTHLRIVLHRPHPMPPWSGVGAPCKTELVHDARATFGSLRVHFSDLVRTHTPRTTQRSSDIDPFFSALLGDFKAVRRHLRHRVLGSRARQWLRRFEHTADPALIRYLLQGNGDDARLAWFFSAWSHHVFRDDFCRPTSPLLTRPMQFSISDQIPMWVAGVNLGKHEGFDDPVRLWIARWISAAGLLAFWRAVLELDPMALPTPLPEVQTVFRQLRSEPPWALGTGQDNQLTLVIFGSRSPVGTLLPSQE